MVIILSSFACLVSFLISSLFPYFIPSLSNFAKIAISVPLQETARFISLWLLYRYRIPIKPLQDTDLSLGLAVGFGFGATSSILQSIELVFLSLQPSIIVVEGRSLWFLQCIVGYLFLLLNIQWGLLMDLHLFGIGSLAVLLLHYGKLLPFRS